MFKLFLSVYTFVLGVFSADLSLAADKKVSQEFLVNIENHYRSLNSIKMDVTKTLKLKLFNKEKQSQGTIQIKKGGKLRWETLHPEHTLIVIEPHVVWVVDYPLDDERVNVIKASHPQKSQPQAVVSFLMGQGKISDAFTLVSKNKEKGDLVNLRLQPKSESEQMKWLTLQVSQESKDIRKLSYEDAVENITELEFKNIISNIELDESQFKFEVPENADVTQID